MKTIINDMWINKNELWTLNQDEISETAFDINMQNMLLKLENDSWWFQYRANIIVKFMKKYFQNDILTVDCGGGNGYTAMIAQNNNFKISLIEPTYIACLNAKKRGIDSYCGVISNESINNGSIPQMMLLDVLEHIEDDEGFIKLIHAKMKQGGRLLITVPAFKCLWSSEDDVAGHFVRYNKKFLVNLLKKYGFKIIYSNYFMSFLFLPILFFRSWSEKLGILKKVQDRNDEENKKIYDKQFKNKNCLVNLILNIFEKIEKCLLILGVKIPFGSSILIIVEK